jgi:hypothetical protein
MSKKLIAVASAAALALTALVGVAPASASPTITYVGAASGAGLTAAAPIVINVPSQNVLRDAGGTSATTSGSVIRVDIDSPLTNQTIRVTSTGAVKLLTTAQFSVSTNRTSAFGAQSLDLVSTEADGFAGFYVYTTSTAVGTFSVTDAGTTIVRHIEGANTVAYAYNVDFTAPTTAGTITVGGVTVELAATDDADAVAEKVAAALQSSVAFGANSCVSVDLAGSKVTLQ